MDSSNLIQMSSSWLLALGCSAANLFFLLINAAAVLLHPAAGPAAGRRKIYSFAFLFILTTYCCLNAFFILTHSLQDPSAVAAQNVISGLPLLAFLFFYKALDSFVSDGFFTVFAVLQLVVMAVSPVLRVLPQEISFFTDIFLFLWFLTVAGFGFYHFSRHIGRTASGNALLLIIMVSLVLFIISLVNDFALSAFEFTILPDYILMAGLTALDFFLTALLFWETPGVLTDLSVKKENPRLEELRASAASLRSFFAYTAEIAGNVENASERLFSMVRNTVNRTAESIERIHSVDSQIKVNITDLKNCLNAFIADISPVLEDRLKTEKSAKSVADIANILEEIENKGKIISSGVVNLTSIIDNAKKNTQKSHKIILDIRTDLDNIDSFSQTIEKVSEEANTLAMNAAIESAGSLNAGGNGFRVVSGDLRGLSAKIKGQTEEIKSVLASLKKDLETGITSTENVKSFFGEIEMITENVFRLILDIVGHAGEIAGTIQESKANIDSLHLLSQHLEKLFNDNRLLTDDLMKEIEMTRNNFYHIAGLIGKGKDIFDALQENAQEMKGKTGDLVRVIGSAKAHLKGLPVPGKAD